MIVSVPGLKARFWMLTDWVLAVSGCCVPEETDGSLEDGEEIVGGLVGLVALFCVPHPARKTSADMAASEPIIFFILLF